MLKTNDLSGGGFEGVENSNDYSHIDFGGVSLEDVLGYVRKSKEALKQELTELQYQVTQESATEEPFANEYNGEFREGIYVDITTGEPLFSSTDKFESGCGWPSFSKPIAPELLSEFEDKRDFNPLAEVRSTTGKAHLGHVFDDGPAELGGFRYCINSAALRFIPKEDMKEQGYEAYLGILEG
jgi:peptide methionine sulfoxide reductase msrA/msrB